MASELRVNTLKDASGNNSVATSVVFGGTAKVWINFNGTGTIATRDSYNVTSITDQGVGLTDITIANDMGNADYAPSGVCGETAGTEVWEITSRAAGVLRIQTYKADTGAALDATVNSVTIHGDLA